MQINAAIMQLRDRGGGGRDLSFSRWKNSTKVGAPHQVSAGILGEGSKLGILKHSACVRPFYNDFLPLPSILFCMLELYEYDHALPIRLFSISFTKS
jgi:hypothetical protein